MRKIPPSVLVQSDVTDGRPPYRRLADRVRELVLSGAVSPGDRLPATRALARAAGVTPATAAHAYRVLAREGFVRSRVGSGTFAHHPAAPFTPDAAAGPPREISGAGLSIDVLKGVFNHILESEGEGAFGYDPAAGYPPLRSSLAAYMEARGIRASAGETVVFSGAQQGLSVIVQGMLQRGDWVLAERPTYPGALRVFERAGVRLETVEPEPGGPNPAVLRRVFETRPLRLAYLMPVYQNPTGICYDEDRMAEIAELCARYRVTLVEDDTCSDLDYGNGRFRPFRALPDVPGLNRIYLKSFSRLLLPGFRLGFCLCDPAQTDLLARVKEENDLASSGFFQRVLHLLLRNGTFDRHVGALEARERSLFQAVLGFAREILPAAGIRFTPPLGGHSLWCRLPDGTDPERFAARVGDLGVHIARGDEFAAGSSSSRRFAWAWDRLPPDDLRQSLEAIARAAALAASGA